jgi:pilus assembly protein FimV
LALNREKIVASAQKFIQRGQLDKAIKEFQRIVEEDPKDVRTLLKIGDLFSKKGERDNAIATYLKVAEFYSEQGFFLKAVAVYKQILKVDPTLIDVNVKLADLYGQLGLGSDALTQYQNVALYYEKAGQTQKTLQILRKMVDLDPSNVGIRIKLAEMFAKESQNKEAIEEFTEAARVLKETQRLGDYAKVGERILFLNPDNLALAKELAEMYLKTNDTKRALAKLQICFKADPRDVPVLEMLASAFLALGQTPKTVSVYRELSKIHADKGEFEKRRQYLRSILELQPDDEETRAELELKAPPSVQTRTQTQAPPASTVQPATSVEDEQLGAAKSERPAAAPAPVASSLKPQELIAKLLTETDVYVKYGLKDKALDHLKKIFSLTPDNLDAHAKVRDIYVQAGDLDGATTTLVTMATIAQKTGKADLAEGWLKEALKLDPDNDAAQAQLKALSPEEAEIIEDVEEDVGTELEMSDSAHDGIELDVEEPPAADDDGIELAVGGDEESLPELPETIEAPVRGPSTGVAATKPLVIQDENGEDGIELEMPEEEAPQGLGLALDDEEPVSDAYDFHPDSSAVALQVPAADEDIDDSEDDDIEDTEGSGDHLLDAPQEPARSTTNREIELPAFEDEAPLAVPSSAPVTKPPLARLDDEATVPEPSRREAEPVDLAPPEESPEEEEGLELDMPVREETRAEQEDAGVALGSSEPPAKELAPKIEEAAAPEPVEVPEPEEEEEILGATEEAPTGDADPDVTDELEEAEFFAQAGLEDESLEAYKNILKKAPRNAVAREALTKLGVEVPPLPVMAPAKPAAVLTPLTPPVVAPAATTKTGSTSLASAAIAAAAAAKNAKAASGDSTRPAGAAASTSETTTAAGAAKALAGATAPADATGSGAKPAVPGARTLGTAPAIATKPMGAATVATGPATVNAPGVAAPSTAPLSAPKPLGATVSGAGATAKPEAKPLVAATSATKPFATTTSPAATPGGTSAVGVAKPVGGTSPVSDKAAPGSLSLALGGHAPATDQTHLGVGAIASAAKAATTTATQSPVAKPAGTGEVKVGGVTKSLVSESALGDTGAFDLASELADDFADAATDTANQPASEDFQFSVEDVLSEFKKGVAATVSEGDFATHYDLGIAYKEMGLTDEAIREFEISSRAKEKEVESLSMIGVCRIELGQHKQAIDAFKKAANSDHVTAQQSVAVQYELGNAHALAGDADTARSLFVKVAKLDPKFRDAASRAAGPSAAPDTGSTPVDPSKKGKISYL